LMDMGGYGLAATSIRSAYSTGNRWTVTFALPECRRVAAGLLTHQRRSAEVSYNIAFKNNCEGE
jgi:hypothetical protein